MATSRGLGQSRDHVSLSRMLHQNAEIVAAVPIFISSPLYRRWHLRWGATDEEVAEPMPGDEFVPVAHFVATRAITICAPPAAVWPWIMQVGFGRAGFCLVTPIRQRYVPRPATVVTVSLSEFGDFAMMRKMLLGIKRRAERYPAPSGPGSSGVPTSPVPESGLRRSGVGWSGLP